MLGHYRASDGIMRDNHEMMLTFQEGERGNLTFADDSAAPVTTQAEVGQADTAAADGSAAPKASSNGFWIMLAMLFVFMYLFVIRPESKRKKKREEFQTSLGKGDQVVTAGGLHGTIAAMDEHTITLKVSDSVRLKFDRIAVSRTASAPAEEAPAAKG
jgi:preprotein translocase subunit YajC